MERAYALKGRTAMWQALLEQEKEDHPEDPSLDMAHAEAALGHSDAAFAEMDRLVKHHDVGMIGINITPEFVPLQADPRYASLLSEIGLPRVR
jgi:hypothetical protein